MIDLTPLEVRKKKGDFRRQMRGYDPALVDDFLDLVADRLEQLVRENMTAQDRLSVLETQVKEFREREKALTEALVSAQELREQGRKQIEKEVEFARRQAEQDAEHIRASALHAREREEQTLRRLRARQSQLIQSFRAFLERELAELAITAETLEVTNALDEAEDDESPSRRDDRKRDSAATPSANPAASATAPSASAAPQVASAASQVAKAASAAPRSNTGASPNAGASPNVTAPNVTTPRTAAPKPTPAGPSNTTTNPAPQPKPAPQQQPKPEAPQQSQQASQAPSQQAAQPHSSAVEQPAIVPPTIAAAPPASPQATQPPVEELTLALNRDFLDIDALAPGAAEDDTDDDSIIDGGWVSLIENKRDTDG